MPLENCLHILSREQTPGYKHIGISWWFSSKEPACKAGDMGLIPGSGRFPEEGNGNPNPVFLPGKFHGQGSLAGSSPRDHRSWTQLSNYTITTVGI